MIGLYTPMCLTARGLVLGAALLASAAFSYAKEGDAELIAARQKFFGVENVQNPSHEARIIETAASVGELQQI
jgi:hypothetical protein